MVVTAFPRAVRVIEHTLIPLKDGTMLAARVWLPEDAELVGDRSRAMWLGRLENVPLFLQRWMQHQRRDAYWRHGSVCEDHGSIQRPVYAVGGWTDGYTNAIARLLEQLTMPRKGLIGPLAHVYPHVARPGPQVGFLQEVLPAPQVPETDFNPAGRGRYDRGSEGNRRA